MKYLVVIEESSTGFAAFSPDVPGCIATGATQAEVRKNMQEALEFHIEGLRADGEAPPPSTTSSFYAEVAA
jgi:predicted RNase H-like HicB family nuclease